MLCSFVTAAAIMLTVVVSCEGSGHVIVTLRSYSNPSHRKSNYKCCDIGFFGCNGCDAYFKLCVTQSTSSSAHSCNIGTSKTPVVGNNDDYQFNANRFRKEFAFTSFRGNVNLQLEVWDWDKISDDDKVETLKRSVKPWTSSPIHYRERLTLQSNPRRVTVKLDLEVYCDKNYYGPSCSVKCVPRDDSSGHYTCDHQGRKVCRRHWYGSSCTRSCVPRDDPRNGHFKCDKEGSKICLSRWEGPSCKRCVKSWFGSRCSTYCVAQDSDEQGHYTCKLSDGKKECLPWWFGTECKAHCIPHDDVDSGHYSCAHDGSKMCLYGWHGENCTVFCIPQDDDQRGHYTCDNEGNKVCLDGYRPPDCTDCLLGRYGANCSLSCLMNDTSPTQPQQGYYYCTENGVKHCSPWWYGPECLQYCVPHDDSVRGHYTCDERDGSKVCRAGWEGSSCLDRKQN